MVGVEVAARGEVVGGVEGRVEATISGCGAASGFLTHP